MGGGILEALREAGLNVESHEVRFRHNTPDEDWLFEVGEKKWIVLTADLAIAKNPLEINALLAAEVRAFAVVREDNMPGIRYAKAIIMALPQIFKMLETDNYPFIARLYIDGSITLWKTEPIHQKGRRSKKRYRPSKKGIKK